MPLSRDRIRLLHMLEHAQEAIQLVEGRSRTNLDEDRILSLALVRLLEIIGEAAVGVSAESRRKFPSMPWVEIVGLRNRLIHGYDSVDLDIVWNIVKSDLPALVRDLSADPDLQFDS